MTIIFFKRKYWEIHNSSVPIEKEVTKIDKNGDEITNTISCRLNFNGSVRFMASSLSNLVNNLTEGIHKIKYSHHNGKL